MCDVDMSGPRVAVIVVTYNSAEHIGECLRSIEGQLPGEGSCIVAFDNASTDGTAEIISARCPNVRLIRSTHNLGFGRACNEASKELETDYILLLNPDAILEPGCIDGLLDLARRFPAAGLYGGRVFSPEGRLTYSCFNRLTLWAMWCNNTGLSEIFSGSRWLNPQVIGERARDTEREVAVIAGSLLLIDRRAWEHLGGFDERFFLYAEDTDLCLRAIDLGYSPMVTPKANIVHVGGASAPSKPTGMVMHYRGEITLIRKMWSGPRRLLAERMLLGGVLLRAVLSHTRPFRVFQPWSEMWQRRQEWMNGW